MNLGRILGLFAIVLGLGAYLYFYELPQAEKEAQKEKLVTADKDAVTGIVLTFPDREIELKKTDGAWRVVRPIDAPADEVAVKGVLGAVVDAEVQKALDEMPSDLSAFGVEKPEPKVQLTLSSGSVPPIAVGAATKIGGKAYVRRGDEQKILLTASSIRMSLNKQPKDLRDKQLVNFKDEDVTKVEIQPAGAATLSLVKKDKDAWTIEPGGHVADINEVRALLSSFRSARAIDFPDDAPTDLAKYGLNAPRLVVTATVTDGSTHTIRLGNDLTEGQQKQVYAQRDGAPTVVTLGDFTLRSLGKDVKALRDKTVLGFDRDRVGKITMVRKDGGTATFVRASDKGWNVEGKDAATSKTTTIERYLDDVHDIRGSDIAADPVTDLAAFGLAAPDVKITLTDKDGQVLGTVLTSKKDTKYYAMREGASVAFEVRDYMFTRLDKQPKDFVNDPAAPSTTRPAAAAGGDDADLDAGDDLGDADPGEDE